MKSLLRHGMVVSDWYASSEKVPYPSHLSRNQILLDKTLRDWIEGLGRKFKNSAASESATMTLHLIVAAKTQ